MGQAWGDAASVEAGRSFEATVATLARGGKKILFGLGGLLGFCAKKIIAAATAKNKANKEYAEESGREDRAAEKGDGKGDVTKALKPVVAGPNITELKPDKSVPEHYNEVFSFDNAEAADKIFAIASLAEKDVRIEDNHLMCKKEDAAAIYMMAKYSGVACCSLSDMMTLHAYAKKMKEEQEQLYPESEVGVKVSIDPAHFEMLEDQSPENVVNFLHEAGVSSAELRDDGKIVAHSEELEALDAGLREESITMGDLRQAAEEVNDLQLGNITERLGKHFKGQVEKQKDSHDHDKDDHDKDDHDDRDRSR